MLLMTLHAAGLLYIVCAVLPEHQHRSVALGTALGWLLHGVSLSLWVFQADALRFGFAVMLSATLWLTVAVYWIENRNFALVGLRRLVLPLAAIAIVLPTLFPGTLLPLTGKSPWFAWHIAVSMLAYGALTVAALHAVLMALQESRLHSLPQTAAVSGGLSLALDRLPPLLTMERLLFRMIVIGFILLSLTVVSGVFFSEQVFGQPFRLEHKTVFSLFSWLLFAVLLAGRHWFGWRGRTALSLTLTGFATLLLAYVGSRFVMEVVLHRSLT
jgi:ABC-type uncharacterized transport system permease subunit